MVSGFGKTVVLEVFGVVALEGRERGTERVKV